MKAYAAGSGAISKSAEPLLRLFMRLGVDEMAALRMINMEDFYDHNCLVELYDKRIESIFHVNKGGRLMLPPIFLAVENITSSYPCSA